jgi:hypothetical protein
MTSLLCTAAMVITPWLDAEAAALAKVSATPTEQCSSTGGQMEGEFCVCDTGAIPQSYDPTKEKCALGVDGPEIVPLS